MVRQLAVAQAQLAGGFMADALQMQQIFFHIHAAAVAG
jgi:hypothetical protein